MEPTKKSPEIEASLTDLIGKNRAEYIRLGKCVFCDSVGHTVSSFRDDLSIKEYQISGLCQVCQDEIWGPNNEEF